MLAVRRFTSVATRKYGSMATRPALGGSGGAHHDDHEHHDHPMWEKLPFRKGPVAAMVFGSLFGGAAIIVWACSFQNKKHGFTK